MTQEVEFKKYHVKGSIHWDEMLSKKYNKFNAYQQARYETVQRWLGEISQKSLVDLGCGDGALTYLLTRTGAKVTGVDNEIEGLDIAKVKFQDYNITVDFVLADVRDTGLPGSSFDIVVSSDVIEHIERPERLVAEAARLLKHDGIFIITTPYRLTEKPGPYHVREFFPGEIVRMLEPYFKNIEVKETHNALWTTLYNHPWKHFKRRQIWRYLINIGTIYFKWNPFLQDGTKRHKRELFTQINVRASKK